METEAVHEAVETFHSHNDFERRPDGFGAASLAIWKELLEGTKVGYLNVSASADL